MVENKAEATTLIIKLVDHVNRTSGLLARTLAATDAPDCPLRQFEGKMQVTLGQYEFELRTELSRLAGQPIAMPDTSDVDLKGFEMMLESYREALTGNLKPHTRAMVNRQFAELRRIYEEFISIHRAA